MNAVSEADEKNCPECGADLLPAAQRRCGILTVEDHDRDFHVRHCNRCGALLIGIGSLPVSVK